MLLEPLHGVGVQHFAPKIRIVARRISAGEHMGAISGAVPGRHGRKVEAVLLQDSSFAGSDIVRNLLRLELMPRLIENRCGGQFRSLETLVELLSADVTFSSSYLGIGFPV